MNDYKAGDPWPLNDALNGLLRDARRNRVRSVAAGMDLVDRALSRFQSPRMWAKLSGSGNPYAFAEQVPNAAGGFDLLPNGRTDVGGLQPAFEANGTTGLGGSYQLLRWSPARDWRFQEQGGAMASSGRTDLIIIPACFCPVPSTLTMTSADPNCNYGMFQSCTIQYQDPPACFAPIGLTSKAFLSTTTFTDRIANAQFYYFLFCQYNLFSLTRLYCKSPYGSPFRDGVLYSWLVGGYGNTCDPFALTNGQAYPGSDASCGVTIS